MAKAKQTKIAETTVKTDVTKVNPQQTTAKSPETPKATGDAKAPEEAKALHLTFLEPTAVMRLKKGHAMALQIEDVKSKRTKFQPVIVTGVHKDHILLDVVNMTQATVGNARLNLVNGELVHTESDQTVKAVAITSPKQLEQVMEVYKNATKPAAEVKLPAVGELVAITFSEDSFNPGLFMGVCMRHYPELGNVFMCVLCNDQVTPHESLFSHAGNVKSGWKDESYLQAVIDLRSGDAIKPEEIALYKTWAAKPKWTPPKAKAAREEPKPAETPKAAETPKTVESKPNGKVPEAPKSAGKPKSSKKPAAAPAPKAAAKRAAK